MALAKLNQYAKLKLKKTKAALTEKAQVENAMASGSALVAAAAAAAIDKRYGDPVTGILRVPGPVPVPAFAVAGGAGVLACILFPAFTGREMVGGAAVGLLCEQITLFTHRETPRPPGT